MSTNQIDKIVSLKQQGKTWAEIGQAVGISGNAARKRYYRQIKHGGQISTSGDTSPEPEVTIIGATAGDNAGLTIGEELGKGKPYGTGCGAIVFDGEGRMFDADNLEMAVKVLDAIR